MDSRDSSAPPSSATVTLSTAVSGGGGEDNDAALSEATVLAKEASVQFQSGRFADCLEVLFKLKQKKEHDPQVLHNIAIAEFFRDGCSDPKKLLQALNDVKKKSEELAHASGEVAESASNVGNKVISVSKGTGVMTHQISSSNSASLIYMGKFGSAVATLNTAIIWFHLHEYSKALSVLEPLYHNIEPIDETIALHVCLLFLDVTLFCQDASKVADALLYLEKAFGVGALSPGDNGNSILQQSPIMVVKSSSIPSGSPATDGSSSDLALSADALDNSLSRSLSISEETLEYESMFSLGVSGRNSATPDNFSRTTVGRSPTSIDLKLQWQLYKVRFLLLTRNLKLTKREVKLVMNNARGSDSSTALLLKSQLECARGNHRKAIKLLMASSNQTEIGVSSMLNNLGCIYYQFGKYHTSSVLFSRALSSASSLQKEKPLRLSTASQNKSLLIMYNCGVQHLTCGNPFLAAHCFHKASLIFYNRPILWLRLAECSLMAFQKGLVKPGGSLSDNLEILVRVIGKGKWRYLTLEDSILNNHQGGSLEKASLLFNDSQLKLSLSLARQCLLNSLHLLNHSESRQLKSSLPHSLSLEENDFNHKNITGFDTEGAILSGGPGHASMNGDVKDQKGVTSQDILQSTISYHEDIQKKENQKIKQAVLADLAFVDLELENPEKALSTARSLLELPGCSKIYIFLAHMYAAEALCFLNKPKEAADHLSMYLSGGDKIELPFTQEDREQLREEKLFDPEESNGGSVPAAKKLPPEESQRIVCLKQHEAHGTLYANFATIYALEGELEQAQVFAARALALVPDNPHAYLTAVYVDIALGECQGAINKLKQCSRVNQMQIFIHLSACERYLDDLI